MSHTPSQELLRYFKYDHLPAPLYGVSEQCAYLARCMEEQLPDGPEKTMGLRKLLEAKDCFVRAMLPKEGEAYADVKESKAHDSWLVGGHTQACCGAFVEEGHFEACTAPRHTMGE